MSESRPAEGRPPAPPDAPPAAARRPRRWRGPKIVAAALAGVAVVLAAMIGVGYLLGANQLPWQETRAGATGREIYARNCAACHGTNGEGGNLDLKGPAFVAGGPLAGLTFAERVEKISRGRPLAGMPAWKFQISDEEIRKVAAYTQVLSGQEPDPSVQDVR